MDLCSGYWGPCGTSRFLTTGVRIWLLIPENTVWVGLEYFVDEGDQLWNMSDEDLIQLGLKEAQQIGFINSAITSTVVPFVCPRRILLILGPTKRYRPSEVCF